MTFIDPYHLLGLHPAEGHLPAKEELRHARKRLLAEFELSEDIVIRYEGRELDKSTVLSILDEMDDPEKAGHYLRIHQQPALKAFLADGKLIHLREVPTGEELGSESFRRWLSAQLIPTFNKELAAAIEHRKKSAATLLLRRLDLIHSWDWDAAFRSTVRYLNFKIREIEELAEQDGTALRFLQSMELFDPILIQMMNRFPDAYQHLRNRYAEALRDLAVSLEDRAVRTDLAYTVISTASQLEVDTAVADNVNHAKAWIWRRRRAHMEQATGASAGSQTETGSPEGLSVPAWVWGAITLLGLFFLRNCNTSASMSSSQFSESMEAAEGAWKSERKLKESLANMGVSEQGQDALIARKLRQDAFLGSLVKAKADPRMIEIDLPTTGSNPYANLFSNMIPDDSTTIRIRSELPVLGYLQRQNGSYAGCFFVAPGDSLDLQVNGFGHQHLLLMTGERWVGNAFLFEHNYYPGFSNVQCPVGLNRTNFCKVLLDFGRHRSHFITLGRDAAIRVLHF